MLGALEGRATRQHILRRYGCVAAQLDGVLMSPQGGAGSSAGCARCAVGARRLSGVLSACGHFDSFDVLTLLCPLLTRLHRQCSMHSCYHLTLAALLRLSGVSVVLSLLPLLPMASCHELCSMVPSAQLHGVHRLHLCIDEWGCGPGRDEARGLRGWISHTVCNCVVQVGVA